MTVPVMATPPSERLRDNREFVRLFPAQATSLVGISSVSLLARHTTPDERGRAYAAHFALTHIFWLLTYPAVGFLSRQYGTPWTFTLGGATAGPATLAALGMARGHRPHDVPAGAGTA